MNRQKIWGEGCRGALRGAMFSAALCAGILLMNGPDAAAAGWTKDGTRWTYVSVSGDYARNVWKKGEDGQERWLDGSGYMVTDAWVKDDGDWYYVDEEGRKLVRTFAELPEPTEDRQGAGKKASAPPSEKSGKTFRYYFSSAGRRVNSRWEEDQGKRYYLGPEGKALTGWILDNMYYTGEDGAALTGWQTIPGPDGTERRYYFNQRGRLYTPEEGKSSTIRTIDGGSFCFGPDGSVLTGWFNAGTKEQPDWRYAEQDGALASGWIQVRTSDGTEKELCFRSNGSGYSGNMEGQLLYKGCLQTASGRSGYRVVTMPEDSGMAGNFLVDEEGMLVMDASVRSRNGVRYTTDRKGRVLTVNGASAGEKKFSSPTEPERE